MKCIKCGNQLKKDDMFCEECGNKVESIVLENEKNSDNLSKVESAVKKEKKKVITILGIAIVVIVLVLLGMNENKKKVAAKNYKVDKENCEFIKNYYDKVYKMAGRNALMVIDSRVYITEVEDKLVLNKELKEALKYEGDDKEIKIEKPLGEGKDTYYVCLLSTDSNVCDTKVITGKKNRKPCVCEFYSGKKYKVLEEKLWCDTLENIINEALANEDIYDEMLELVESNKGYTFQIKSNGDNTAYKDLNTFLKEEINKEKINCKNSAQTYEVYIEYDEISEGNGLGTIKIIPNKTGNKLSKKDFENNNIDTKAEKLLEEIYEEKIKDEVEEDEYEAEEDELAEIEYTPEELDNMECVSIECGINACLADEAVYNEAKQILKEKEYIIEIQDSSTILNAGEKMEKELLEWIVDLNKTKEEGKDSYFVKIYGNGNEVGRIKVVTGKHEEKPDFD